MHTEPRMIFRGIHKGFYKTIYYPKSDKPVTLYTRTIESVRKFIKKQEAKRLDYAKKQMFGSLKDNVGKTR